ncbi:MAG TPA: 1-acyl-sn-glycerol-3-phosphate acyltransferase [Syntrophomonadaceae bacterium]|nr:1-acyl-sn-glycerol-3-phosphate acyltransferase [Syntrophomonadaceae bacterium]
MLAFVWKRLFKMAGWKTVGRLPSDVKKYIIVAAPHTSNWDFFYARATAYILDIKVNYLIKSDWLVFPLSIFFKITGAIGVKRKKGKKGLVDKLVEKINKVDELAIIVAPEGTRKAVNRWKTGFYHLAVQAELPIALAYLDYAKKEAGIGAIIYPSGNYYGDMFKIREFYKSITPKFPENYRINILPEFEFDKILDI